jgi:hypothetical protein
MSRAFDDFNEGKFSKQHLGMLSSRPNFEIQLMVKIITRGYYRKESAALNPQANTETSNISEN